MSDIEKKLKNLFDYQRFERHRELQGIVDEVINQYNTDAVFLDDVQLSFATGGRKEDEVERKDLFDDNKE